MLIFVYGWSDIDFFGFERVNTVYPRRGCSFFDCFKNGFPEHRVNKDVIPEGPFIVPLAIPMIVGSSAIAVLLLLASKYPEKFGSGPVH